MHACRPELGMIQPSLISQRAVLKRRGGYERPVILRSTDPAETDRDAMILLLQEAIIMAQIRHPNVVQLHGLVMEDKKVQLRYLYVLCPVQLHACICMCLFSSC